MSIGTTAIPDAAVSVTVPAKVNLALCVGARREDGYHDLATVFQAVSLFDEIVARPRSDGQIVLQMSGEGSEELAWLDSLDARLRWETIEKIVQFRPLALVISTETQ